MRSCHLKSEGVYYYSNVGKSTLGVLWNVVIYVHKRINRAMRLVHVVTKVLFKLYKENQRQKQTNKKIKSVLGPSRRGASGHRSCIKDGETRWTMCHNSNCTHSWNKMHNAKQRLALKRYKNQAVKLAEHI